MVAEDLISRGYPLVRRVALEFSDKLPAGTTIDDLVSLGGEEIVRANNSFDPANGRTWPSFLAKWLRFQYRSYLRTARRRVKRHRSLEILTGEGECLPRADLRAVEPSEHAERREEEFKGRATIAALKITLPSPNEVAVKAQKMRQEVYDAFVPGDMSDVMKAVMTRAKTGDLAAAKLLLAMLGVGGRHPLFHTPEEY